MHVLLGNPCIISGLVAPLHGVLDNSCEDGSSKDHATSCSIQCDPGYALTGSLPACNDGVLYAGSASCAGDIEVILVSIIFLLLSSLLLTPHPPPFDFGFQKLMNVLVIHAGMVAHAATKSTPTTALALLGIQGPTVKLVPAPYPTVHISKPHCSVDPRLSVHLV